MKKVIIISIVFLFTNLIAVAIANAQETFGGTVYKYGTGRYTGLRTSGFTLTLNSITPDDEAQRDLDMLQSGGQDKFIDALHDNNLGSFSLTGELGRTIITDTRGKRRQHAKDLRGFRTLDRICRGAKWLPLAGLPIRLYRTYDRPSDRKGKRPVSAAKIRWKTDAKNGSHVEVEDYATFPAKLVNVRTEGGKR